MKADSLRMSKVFASGGDVHYILPYFQREYAWEKENWKTLLNDVFSIYEAYDPNNEPEHFMGSLVVINDGTRNGVVPAFKLVDGQQRLTTISILLCALGRLVDASNQGIKNRIKKLLTNPDEDGLLHYKVLPTPKYGDRAVYIALLNDEVPPSSDSKIPEAYDFIYKEISLRIQQGKIDPERLFIVICNCLQVVFIDLNQNERPYEIFESLNAKGKLLTQADLVRNYIAMKLPEARQGEVFEKYWSKVEEMLQEKRTVGRSRMGELTAFLRHYLSMRSGGLINENHVYARFRDRIENEFPDSKKFEQEIETLKRYGEYYNRLLRPENEPDQEIREKLSRLNVLEITTAYPFLMAAYDAFSRGLLTRADFLEGLSIIENYIVRRHISGEPTNYTNKMFPTLWREVDPSNYVESLKKALVSKSYPLDHRIRQAVLSEQLYDKRSETRAKVVLILETVNRYLSKKDGSGAYTVLSGEPTIEHIMPQTLDGQWKDDLGLNWEQIYQEFLDTLGNLTLVTQDWNSTLSNGTFLTKKPKLASHGLKLNSDYFNKPILQWGENAIRDRAEWLASHILAVWPQIGTPVISPTKISTKPTILMVMGQSFVVATWRDVAYQTALCVADLVDDFDQLAHQFPAYFDNKEFKHASKQLPNGWWLNLNLSAASVKSFCRNLISAVEISEDDWQVEEE